MKSLTSATTPVSPKIVAGANATLILGLVVTLLGALQPGSLDFLGRWAPLAYVIAAIVSFAGAAYLKTDSLREAGVAAIQKAAEEAAAALEASKQTSLAATAINVPTASDAAPATTFPKDAVAAAEAAVVPAPPVVPVFEAPVAAGTTPTV